MLRQCFEKNSLVKFYVLHRGEEENVYWCFVGVNVREINKEMVV